MAPLTDLQFAVLTSLAGSRNHGYALLGEVEMALQKQIAVATAYACFDGLATRGWIIRDGDEIVNGRTRRFYRLSPEGADVLHRRADELAERSRVALARLRSGSAVDGAAVTA